MVEEEIHDWGDIQRHRHHPPLTSYSRPATTTSSIYASPQQGMLYSTNLRTTMEVEAIVSDNNVIPTAIAILDGFGQFSFLKFPVGTRMFPISSF